MMFMDWLFRVMDILGGVAVVTSAVFAVLKWIEKIDWSWRSVLLPVVIYLGLWVVICFLVGLGVILTSRMN